MPYNSRADVVRLLAERYDTESNIKLGGFQSQLQASYVSSRTEVLWYNEKVCLLMTIYIYIYIFLYIYVYICVLEIKLNLNQRWGSSSEICGVTPLVATIPRYTLTQSYIFS